VLIDLESRRLHHRRFGSRSDAERQGERSALPTLIERRTWLGRLIFVVLVTVVMVVTEVDVKMEETGAGRTVTMPVEGGMGAEAESHHCRQGHQPGARPLNGGSETQTPSSQHRLRLYACLRHCQQRSPIFMLAAR